MFARLLAGPASIHQVERRPRVLILLPDTRAASAVQVAERIRQRIANAPLPFALTVSIGLAAGEPTRDWSEQVFDRADQALYRAKAGGRNRVVVDDTPLLA